MNRVYAFVCRHARGIAVGLAGLGASAMALATSTTPAALGTAFTAGGTEGTDITTDLAAALVGFVILKKILRRFGLV